MPLREFIFGFIATKLNLKVLPWLENASTQLENAPDDKTVFTLYSAAIRHSGKGSLALEPQALAKAKYLVPGWNPIDWTLDQAVRIYLLLALPPTSKSALQMDMLYQTADLGEALALLKALPLLPNPVAHLARAREGARSNVKSQFEAVALRNPYPAEQFDEIAWNQMVSKAIFVDSPLEEIVGLDRRANRTLNGILVDLLKERHAAGRTFSSQLYRCLGRYAEEAELDLMEKALEALPPKDQSIVVKGLALSPSLRAAHILLNYRKHHPTDAQESLVQEPLSHDR